jgi:hypothetical protein
MDAEELETSEGMIEKRTELPAMLVCARRNCVRAGHAWGRRVLTGGAQQPAVVAKPDFSAEEAAKGLFKAFKGFGCDKDAIRTIIFSISNPQVALASTVAGCCGPWKRSDR